MPPAPAAPQFEVEQFFINKGYLIPSFHKVYWMGLNSDTATYPVFSWSDPTVKTDYLLKGPHWGTYTVLNSAAEPKKEPNAIQPPEYCGVANSSQAYGNPRAWGWSDINCNHNYIFICRLQSERPAPATLPLPLPLPLHALQMTAALPALCISLLMPPCHTQPPGTSSSTRAAPPSSATCSTLSSTTRPVPSWLATTWAAA